MWIIWVIIGLVVGAAIMGLVAWMRSKGLKVAWYEWLIGAIGLFLLVFTIQNFYGSFVENEPQAAPMMLLVIGLPSLVLLAIAGLLAWRRNRTA